MSKVQTAGKSKTLKIVIPLVVLALLIFVGGSILFMQSASSSELIRENVYVNDILVGNMSVEQATEALQDAYLTFTADKKASIVLGDEEDSLSLNELAVRIDFDATVKKAFDYGRGGDVFSRLSNLFSSSLSKVVISLEIELDNVKLNESLQVFSDKINKSANLFELDEVNAKVTVFDLKSHKLIDINKTSELLIDGIKSAKLDVITPVFTESADPRATAEMLHKNISRAPKNATIETKNGEVVYVPETNGIDFDIAEVEKLLAQSDDKITFDIKIAKPEITTAILKSKAFTDTLASCNTNYDSSVVGRSTNLRVSCQKINGYIIPAGGEFSFNRIVGMRTAAAGFATGKIYVDKGMIDDVGGGICQVVSTLYTTALKSNLKITERHNHRFTVAYIPLGQDATVSYGALDFRFVNDTKYPIKVQASASGGVVSISFVGTKPDPSLSVEILNERKGTTTFATREEKNPDPAAKSRVVSQGGSNGATVDTYKIIKRNGAEISRTFLHKSVYQPMDKLILVPQNETAGAPADQTPNPSEIPSEDPSENPSENPAENQPSATPTGSASPKPSPTGSTTSPTKAPAPQTPTGAPTGTPTPHNTTPPTSTPVKTQPPEYDAPITLD